MPQEPKKRHSRQRQGKRRHSINFGIPHGVLCENCGANNMPHVICKKCGFYQGRQVLNLEKKVKNKDEEPAGPQA
ncbi:MAG: 50S ribosomal protein L32 [Patescibacteria group bacterium]